MKQFRGRRPGQTRHPAQAGGGAEATAGFHFQFVAVLHASTRAWLKLPPTKRFDPTVFSECVSDAIDVTDPGIVLVTQAKRTQTSKSVKRALDELWLVYRVALFDTPDLLPRLQFRILSARAELKNAKTSIGSWHPDGVPAKDPAVSNFKALVDAEHRPDPESELLALLANDFAAPDPVGIVQRWTGRLLEAAVRTGGFPDAARDIWNDLRGLATRSGPLKPPGIYVWTAADRPPTTVQPGNTLTGQQPLVQHLREGYFAERQEVFDGLTSHAMTWLEKDPVGADRALRLPLFWVGGRSGAGKSVALLHVLAQLHERGFGPILFLGNKVSHLPAAIRWSQLIRKGSNPVLIAIDDPYSPAVQGEATTTWRAALAELEDARQAGNEASVPLILCCGPTEQADRLSEDFPDDVRLEMKELPPDQSLDLAYLRAWYRLREQKEPPETGDVNVLLVQLFFEWRTGEPIREFSLRFRGRIRSSDATGAVEHVLSCMLALNRLYVGYCRAAIEAKLDATQREVLERLRIEAHVQEDANDDRPGLWLAHPHLANTIYECWYPSPGSAISRTEHLLTAIQDSLNSGRDASEQLAPMWTLSRVLSASPSEEELAERLDPTTVQKLLPKIYLDWVSRRLLTVARLPVWVQIRAFSPDLDLTPDPVELALEHLRPEFAGETGLRLTCHKLLQHLDRFPDSLRRRVADTIVGFLEVSLDWHEWSHVALDAVQRTRDTRLGPLVAQWLQTYAHYRSAPRLLHRALRVLPLDAELRREALNCLRRAQEIEGAWGNVGSVLLDGLEPAPLPEAIAVWIERHHLSYEACFTLRRAIPLSPSQVVPWAEAWLQRWRAVPFANFVLEPLCDVALTPQLRQWCCDWLNAAHSESGFLVEKLVRLLPGDGDVHVLARQWLRRVPKDDGSWPFVCRALIRECKDDESVGLYREWLEESTQHKAWSKVWVDLWKSQPADDSLAELGFTWLASTPSDHGSWVYVWEALWKARPGDARLLSRAMEWLQRAPQRWLWTIVWRELWRTRADDPDLETVGRAWLDAQAMTDGGWSFVWRDIFDAHPVDQDLTALGVRWLRQADENEGAWRYVWQRLWTDELPRDPELLAITREWLLKSSVAYPGWRQIWESVRSEVPGDIEITMLGLQWLSKSSEVDSYWLPIWRVVRDALPRDPEIIRLARGWLGGAGLGLPSWTYVWQEAMAGASQDPVLIELGMGWLREVRQDHPAWSHIWRALWKAFPDDVELTERGEQWLQNNLDHNSWSYVWMELWMSSSRSSDLMTLGRMWLDSSVGRRRWPDVFQAFWGSVEDRHLVLNAARRWLRINPRLPISEEIQQAVEACHDTRPNAAHSRVQVPSGRGPRRR
jgi:hypothetical protein